VNVKGQFLVARYFLQLLGTEQKATYIGLTSLAATAVIPGLSGYALAKLGSQQLTAYVAAENPNVTAVAYHPGVVTTDMHNEMKDFQPFAFDTPELSGAVAVWLATEAATFLTGRYVTLNWAVDELLALKEEITGSDALKLKVGGNLKDATLVS
jgi:NAD(P)-dependent dehydrogenase (short-subunit alcohol dehydrogenase family)